MIACLMCQVLVWRCSMGITFEATFETAVPIATEPHANESQFLQHGSLLLVSVIASMTSRVAVALFVACLPVAHHPSTSG